MGPIIVDTLIDTLTKSTEEVFETMVFCTLTSLLPIEGDALRPSSNVVGTVGFAGGACGLVAFYSTLDAARDIAGSMLGMEPAQVNGEMADAIGEITNMIAGSFRTKMATRGHHWAISVPTVTVGSDFYIKPLVNGRRVLIPFKMDEHEVFVELLAHRYGFGCPPNGRELLEDPVAEYLKLDATWLEATDVHAPGLYEVARQILV